MKNWLGQTATYNYDDAGRLVSLTNFNGTITTYTLDDADRLTGMNTKTSGNSVVASFAYTLDNNGNRVSIDKNIPNTGTLPVRNETATYSHNRLASTDTAKYDYDNEGKLAAKQAGGTTNYSFDDAYRLVGIGSTETFGYDGSGNRLRAVRSGVETRYIYDVNGNLLAEADANVITRYYVHGAGLLAAITPDDAVYCYHFDGVGNTVAITDNSEAVVNSYDYSTFGMILAENEGFSQPFKFVGRLGVMAESNGFYYMRARYYDPVIGRFISEDPLGFDGGDVNLYVYGGNNPLLVVDPWGMESQSFASRFRTNYNNSLNELYGEDLRIADTLGAWGIGAAIVNTATSSLQSVTDSLATEQIANARIAGALRGGNIFSRISASNAGARIAARTTVLRTGLRATGAISSIVGAGATGYSIGARLNAAGHALYNSF